MITLRRDGERQREHTGELDLRRTLVPPDAPGQITGFGALAALDEGRVAPGARIRWHGPGEAVVYVREGALAFDDPRASSGVIAAGEFRRTTSRRDGERTWLCASQTAAAHAFHIRLHLPAGDGVLADTLVDEQKRFSTAQRRGLLCVIASTDGRRGSIPIRQDAVIVSALLDAGQHVVYPLSPGRRAWLHVVAGEATLGDAALSTGDGAGIQAEVAVSLTAREATEILLLDLCAPSGNVASAAGPQ